MPPKLRYVRMPKDDLAWQKNDEEAETWEKSLNKADVYRTIADIIKNIRVGSDAPPDEDGVRAPDISEQKLEFLYGQMANIMLQLSALAFPRIGPLVQEADGRFTVSGRPLIQNMNSLVEFTGIPATLVPSQPYSSANEWYSALADMHFAQLTFQRNDAVLDEEDTRDKYVARQLFRRLASKGATFVWV
ncbi:Uu.00g088070.m01.CDS01 [Anthostomella pinea]|uniref:Uu.00g088070.m01.CDS01 n=1 Tax=Anthostomella pinea TaxID=933095 RepID=A0AAI8YJX8_9PEZI|nr:Uu.00g088070.m01.CDS01 [Anthostomella pinea]